MARADPVTAVRDLVVGRGVTRLCHLTPFVNLLQIAQGSSLRSVTELSQDHRAAFDQQDLERLDGHPDHISCSVQYPNVWYLRSRRRDATPLQRLSPTGYAYSSIRLTCGGTGR